MSSFSGIVATTNKSEYKIIVYTMAGVMHYAATIIKHLYSTYMHSKPILFDVVSLVLKLLNLYIGTTEGNVCNIATSVHISTLYFLICLQRHLSQHLP